MYKHPALDIFVDGWQVTDRVAKTIMKTPSQDQDSIRLGLLSYTLMCTACKLLLTLTSTRHGTDHEGEVTGEYLLLGHHTQSPSSAGGKVKGTAGKKKKKKKVTLPDRQEELSQEIRTTQFYLEIFFKNITASHTMPV